MILELLIKPISGSKKLLNTMSQNVLIGLSIAIPVLIALIPSFIIKQTVGSVLKPFEGLGGMFGDNIGKGTSTITSSIGSYIFKYVFGNVFLFVCILTILIFAALVVYSNINKLEIAPKYIWQSMVVSGIQIIYYLLIGGILSFISYYFSAICIIGITNSAICLYAHISENINVQKYAEDSETETFDISNEAYLETAAVTEAAVQMPAFVTVPNTFETKENNEKSPSVSLDEKVKSLSSKQKKMIGATVSIIAIVVIFAFIGSSVTGKEHVSQKLEQAIKNNDCKEMARYIVSSDSRLKVDENAIKPYADFLKDNPSYTSSVLASMDSQSKGKVDKVSGNISNGNNLITLTTSGKKYLFFNNYVYKLPAYFIKVKTEYKNTKIFINDKELYTSDKENEIKECGPYLLGKYKLEAKLKTDYTEVTGKQDVTLNSQGMTSNSIEVNAQIDGEKLRLYSEYEDAKILVNGKDTGVTVKDVDKLVPLPKDGNCKIQLENQFPWGTLKSDEKIIGKGNMEFSFVKGNAELVNTIKPVIQDFMKSYESAYKALDASKLSSISDNFKKNLTSDINFKNSYKSLSNGAFTGALTSVTIDPDSMKLNHNGFNGDSYSIYIKASINGDLSYDGRKYFNDDTYSIYLMYDTTQKKWLADSLSGNWFGEKIKNGTEIKIN